MILKLYVGNGCFTNHSGVEKKHFHFRVSLVKLREVVNGLGLVSRNLQASPELWIIVQIQSALKVCLAEMSLLCSFGVFLNLMHQKQFFQPKKK